MRINFITLNLLLLVIFNIRILAQLEIKLETDKAEYNRGDSILAVYKVKNVTNDVIIFINKIYIDSDKHCFGVYRYKDYVQMYNGDNHKLENFLTIHPAEEISMTKVLDVSWLCRSAPPRGDWNIELSCILTVNDTDNYYIINNAEKQKSKIKIFDAWIGSVVSNKVNVIIKRSD